MAELVLASLATADLVIKVGKTSLTNQSIGANAAHPSIP